MRRTRLRSVAFVAGALLLVGACSDSKKVTGADPSSTTTGESTTSVADTSTTVVDAGSTTTAPSTTVVETTTAATAAPTTVAGGGGGGGGGTTGGVRLGQPTNLQGVSVPTVSLPSDFLCDGTDPGIPGWTLVDCQQMPSYNAGVTTLVTRRVDDGSFGVFVLFQEEGALRSLFEAYEPGAGTWDSVTVQLGDFHFDDGAEVWVGYRYAGSGSYLDLDVLDPQPEGPDFPATREFFLGGLQGLDGGQVDMHPGGATVLSSVYAGSDPNCCPSSFLVREITWAADEWRIDTGTTYPAASAPAVFSDF
jgi:hypothetical protein